RQPSPRRDRRPVERPGRIATNDAVAAHRTHAGQSEFRLGYARGGVIRSPLFPREIGRELGERIAARPAAGRIKSKCEISLRLSWAELIQDAFKMGVCECPAGRISAKSRIKVTYAE